MGNDPNVTKMSVLVPTNKRPPCCFCGKKLRPLISSVDIPLDAPLPSIGSELREVWICHGVTKVKPSFMSRDSKQVEFWTGTYHGYGRDRDGVTLFCSTGCAVAYAQTAARRDG